MQGNPIATEDQQRKENQNKSRTDKAQLLTGHRKDEIVMLLRQVQKLLPAAAQAQAAEAAGADGIQGLDDLIPPVRGIGKGIPPGADAAGSIGEKGQQHRQRPKDRAESRKKPPQAYTAQEQHHAADGDNNDGGGKMGFQNQEPDNYT